MPNLKQEYFPESLMFMKKILVLALAATVGLSTFAQQPLGVTSSKIKDVAVKVSTAAQVHKQSALLELPVNPTVKSSLTSIETEIGNTKFDFQTNGSMPQRIYEYNDGTIGASWAFGLTNPNYDDRGTGYNYFDGTTWGTIPTARIENVKTGYPCYAPWGSGGEIVVSHTNTSSGLKIAKRTTKGSGTWTLSTKAGPSGHLNILWPRVATSGLNNEFIHLFALTAPEENGGTPLNGQDGALLYSRSNNGGSSWAINNVVLPGTDSTFYNSLHSDSYAFAKPVGNTLAFVYGNIWSDIFLLKSIDNGDTWTKTIIYQHPYPKFDEKTTLVTDTIFVCDNFLSVALDNTGAAYVFFGIQRVTNDVVNDSSFSLFPFTDGLAFWKEGQSPFTSLDPIDVNATGNLVGWTQDVNGNDTVMEFIANPAVYFASVTSMPTTTIDQVNNKIYVFFSSVVEGLTNGFQNYRHIYVKRSDDLGATWTDFGDVTGDAAHNSDECVYPSVSPTSDQFYCHLIYQKDQKPGLSYDGDLDPAGNNAMVYLKYAKLGVGIDNNAGNINNVTQNYPNPFQGSTRIDVQLASACTLSLEVTNTLGQRVWSIPAMEGKQGQNSLTIDAKTLQPGLYFYTVYAGDSSVTHKMVVR